MAMTTVQLVHGGACERFMLVAGTKLHLPTICNTFKLDNVQLNGVTYPTDSEGLTLHAFEADAVFVVSGVPRSSAGHDEAFGISEAEIEEYSRMVACGEYDGGEFRWRAMREADKLLKRQAKRVDGSSKQE